MQAQTVILCNVTSPDYIFCLDFNVEKPRKITVCASISLNNYRYGLLGTQRLSAIYFLQIHSFGKIITKIVDLLCQHNKSNMTTVHYSKTCIYELTNTTINLAGNLELSFLSVSTEWCNKRSMLRITKWTFDGIFQNNKLGAVHAFKPMTSTCLPIGRIQ